MCRRRCLFSSPSPREKRGQEAPGTPLSPPPLTLPPPPPREPRAGGCTACPRAAAAGARARPHPPPARLAQLPLLPLHGRPTPAAARLSPAPRPHARARAHPPSPRLSRRARPRPAGSRGLPGSLLPRPLPSCRVCRKQKAGGRPRSRA